MQGRIVGAQGINAGSISQYAGMDEKMKSIMPESESPVNEALSRITALLEDTHNAMSLLDKRLEPISASMPTGEDECKPACSMPSKIENRLMNIQDGLTQLHRRIIAARDSLRI